MAVDKTEVKAVLSSKSSSKKQKKEESSSSSSSDSDSDSSSGSDSDKSVFSDSSSSDSDSDDDKKSSSSTAQVGAKRDRDAATSSSSSSSTTTAATAADADSKTIFVSNMSVDTTAETLQARFGQHGVIAHCRILLSRKKVSRGLAYIEFATAEAAQTATRKLNGKSIDAAVVTVVVSTKPSEFVHTEAVAKEWTAPSVKLTKDDKNKAKSVADKAANVLAKTKLTAAQLNEQLNDTPAAAAKVVREKVMRDDGTWNHEVSAKPEKCMTVFITNMPFGVTEEQMREKFEPCGAIAYLNLVVDAEGRQKGFAYVQYEKTESVDEAVKHNETELNGRRIRVDFARPLRERYANHVNHGRTPSHTVNSAGKAVTRRG